MRVFDSKKRAREKHTGFQAVCRLQQAARSNSGRCCRDGLASQDHCPWLNQLFVQAHAAPTDDVGAGAALDQLLPPKLQPRGRTLLDGALYGPNTMCL